MKATPRVPEAAAAAARGTHGSNGLLGNEEFVVGLFQLRFDLFQLRALVRNQRHQLAQVDQVVRVVT